MSNINSQLCRDHRVDIENAFKQKDKDLILKTVYSCPDHYLSIMSHLIKNNYNAVVIDFYKSASIDESKIKQKGIRQLIHRAIEYFNNEIFDYFIQILVTSEQISENDKLMYFTDAVLRKNSYALTKLEAMKLLPEDFQVLRSVTEGNVSILGTSHLWTHKTIHRVFHQAISVRGCSAANSNFIRHLISIFGIDHCAYNFSKILEFAVKNHDANEKYIPRYECDRIKFFISSGVPANILMNCALPLYLAKFIHNDRNFEFLIKHGVQNFTKLEFDKKYQLLLSYLVFSYKPHIVVKGGNVSYLLEGKSIILDGVSARKVVLICTFMRELNNRIKTVLPPVLSIIIINYLYAINNSVLNYNYESFSNTE